MQFPPEFETGDGADMRLPNHVFNQLKVHSKVDNKRGHRVHEKKEHATAVCIVLMYNNNYRLTAVCPGQPG